MLTSKHEPIVFGFILSGLMSFLVSGISTFRAAGVGAAFLDLWLRAWLTSWLVAFPTVLMVAPVARRLAKKVIEAVGKPA